MDIAAARRSTAPLSDAQQPIEDAGLLRPPMSAVLNVPTGFGKTFLARRAIHASLDAGFGAVYLCPLRALARELYGDWQQEFPGLGVYTGEVGVDEAQQIPAPGEATVIIATPEKFDGYLRSWQDNLGWLANVDLLVVDEGHMLADPHRGATLEGIIARFRIINPFLRVLMLSATLGNPEELARWLDAELFKSSERPVPLAWRIETFNAKEQGAKGKADIAVREAAATATEDGQSIVFCQSRPRTESLAATMREQGLRAEAHHAGLSPTKRLHVEARFRAGELDVVIATPTLAMGINMPCRKAIIHDLQRFTDGGWTDLSVTETWQLAGRAGRRGFDVEGEVVLISPKHDQTTARRFIKGRFEPVNSALKHSRKLAEQVLVLFGSRMCKTQAQAIRLMGGYLHARQIGNYLEGDVQRSIDSMLRAGMMEEQEGGVLRATRLGYLAVRHQLSPETVIAWRDFITDCREAGKEPTFMDVLTLTAGSIDFNNRMRADADDLTLLADALNQEPMVLKGIPITSWSPTYLQTTGKNIVFAVKTALGLRAWTRLGDEDEAAEVVGAQAHEVEEARKEMCRLLAAFHAVLVLLRPDEEEDTAPTETVELAERVRALAAMVATGMNEQNASLSLVDGIGPVWARRLVAAGVEDIEDLAQADTEEIEALGGISAQRATAWIDAASILIESGGAYRYREIAAGQQVFSAGAGIDYYRWMRAATLTVAWQDEGQATVTGGSAPHRVIRQASRWTCDCADAARGRGMCKHEIAVRHAQEDSTIPRFGSTFATSDEEQSLWNVWNDSGRKSWK